MENDVPGTRCIPGKLNLPSEGRASLLRARLLKRSRETAYF
jgi:hypothetical protein